MSFVRSNIFGSVSEPYTSIRNLVISKPSHYSYNMPDCKVVSGIMKLNGEDYVARPSVFSDSKFSNLGPVIESICSDILDLFGLNHIKCSLKRSMIPSNEYWKEQEVLCSTFKHRNLSNVKDLLGVTDNLFHYDKLVREFSELDINDLIVVDYLFFNDNRSLDKIMFEENGVSRNIVLSDFNLCLGYDVQDCDLLDECGVDNCYEEYNDYCDSDLCSSYRINSVRLTRINLNIDFKDLSKIVNKYSEYLPGYRINFILCVLYRRLYRLKKMFTMSDCGYFKRKL